MNTHLYITDNKILSNFERYCKFCIRNILSDDTEKNPTPNSSQTVYKSGVFSVNFPYKEIIV